MRLSGILATATAVVFVLLLALGVWLYSSPHAGDFARTEDVAPGGTLHVDLELGDVAIETHDESTVEIEARSGGWPWHADFTLTREGANVRLEARSGTADGAIATAVEWLLWPFHLLQVDVRARVPRRFAATVRSAGGDVDVEGLAGDTRVETSGGRIDVEDVEGQVDAMTSGGRIEIAGVRGDVRAETSGGRIRIEDVRGSVVARTNGGSIDVREAGGSVAAETSGGRISVRFAGSPSGNLETRGGRIEVRLPSDAGVSLEASTSGGRVELDEDVSFEGESRPEHVRGAVNGGGAPLRVRTSGGGIRIETD